MHLFCLEVNTQTAGRVCGPAATAEWAGRGAVRGVPLTVSTCTLFCHCKDQRMLYH